MHEVPGFGSYQSPQRGDRAQVVQRLRCTHQVGNMDEAYATIPGLRLGGAGLTDRGPDGDGNIEGLGVEAGDREQRVLR